MTSPPPDPTRQRALWFAPAFSVLFFAAYYALFGDVGFYPGDEGYLWYGVVRTLAGEVPLRDFQSYEPGRYYWCAAFAGVFGQGLLGLRAACMAFGAIGLTCAVVVASRFTRNRAELAACGTLIGLWMFPTFKLFEPALACVTTWFAVRLLERPSPERHLAAGVYVGLAGFIGRNHALYAAVAFGALLLVRLWKERPQGAGRGIALLALGALLGHAPMWFMFLFVPGFAAGFIDSCRIFLEHGSQPIPYPWRWPWTVEWGQLAGWGLAIEGALTLVFLVPVVALPLGVLRTLRFSAEELRRNAAFAAAAFVGAVYIHHASVRSFPLHLAQCLPPVLLLALCGVAGLTGWPRRALHGALALVLVLALFSTHPVLTLFQPGEPSWGLVEHEVAGESLHVPRVLGRYLDRLEQAIEQIPRDEPVFFAPNRPVFYPLFGRVAPVRWIYFLWKARGEEQAELVSALEERGVDWVLITDQPVDEREDMRFSATHPLVWAYLEREFEELHGMTPRSDRLFHRR